MDDEAFNVEVTVSPDVSRFKANINQEITISGLAKNARLGAIVMTEDYTPIYMDGIKKWDRDIVGKPVAVTGILRRKSLAPKATVNSAGEVSHGVEGDTYVLENPTWVINE